MKQDLKSHYEKFYSNRNPSKVYPTEFVVRIFLSKYPGLYFKSPQKQDKIIDIGFGDGRNTLFLCEQGLDVYGSEITDTIVNLTKARINRLGYEPELKVGRNSNLPFESNYFDYILASHVCYYCDDGETIVDNLKEYYRILKPRGFLIASVPDIDSYIFKDACKLDDGTYRIASDPYKNRIGYRLFGFSNIDEIENIFSLYFKEFSYGHAQNNYFGIDERVFWVVCQNKKEIQ